MLFIDKLKLAFKWSFCEFRLELKLVTFCFSSVTNLWYYYTTPDFIKGLWKFIVKLKEINIFHYYKCIFQNSRKYSFFSNNITPYEYGSKVMIFSFIKFWKNATQSYT